MSHRGHKLFASSRNGKESKNPVLWPWPLTYDLEILWVLSGCRGTRSCKNFIQLSAAVHEYSCSQRKKNSDGKSCYVKHKNPETDSYVITIYYCYSARLLIQRVEGWVDHGGWLHTENPRWFTCPQTVTHPGTNRARRRVAYNLLPASHAECRRPGTKPNFKPTSDDR